MLTEKYLAGFIDADGYIGIRSRIGARPDCEIQVSQRILYREPIDAVVAEFGGFSRIRVIDGGEYVSADLRGGNAVKLLERLAKYAVVKGPWMRAALELVRHAEIHRTAEQVASFRDVWKQIKRESSHTEKNFPSRKWLAGYIDGDGTFTVKVCPKTGYAYPHVSVLSEPHMDVGIRLIEKAFGGNLCKLSTGNAQWTLHLSQPSKIEKFVSFFADHLIIKKAQAYYLLALARGGNLRDGETIRSHMRGLNAQQHRLSDPASHAADLASAVSFEIPMRALGRPRGLKRQSALQL
jgi:hypothetical protein